MCSSLLPTITVGEDLEPQASAFLDSINRGGLVNLTDFAFKPAVHCWRVFKELWTDKNRRRSFFSRLHIQCCCARSWTVQRTQPSTCTCCLVLACAVPATTSRLISSADSSTASQWTSSNSSPALPVTQQLRITRLTSSSSLHPTRHADHTHRR